MANSRKISVQKIHVGSKKLRPLDVVSCVDLLVLGVSSVIGCTHGKEDDILAGRFLQGDGDGDGAALAGQIGFDSVNHLSGPTSGDVVGVLGVRDPAASAMSHVDLHDVWRVALGPLLVDVVHNNLLDNFRRLIGDDSNGELPNYFPRNDGFRSGFAERSLN